MIWPIALETLSLFLRQVHHRELTQLHMTQTPVLWGEVGASVLRVCSQTRKDVWASACGAGALGWVGVCCEADWGVVVVVGQLSLLWRCSPAEIVKMNEQLRFVSETIYALW